MPVIDADGTPINVEVEGKADGPVLMLSNSLGTNLHMWDEQAQALSGRFRLVRYDPRGHGNSGAPDGIYSIERLGRDVIAILGTLGLERVHFCGLSMGGMTGMWLARHFPDRLGRLVLANTAPKSQTPDLWNMRIRAVRANGVGAIADMVLGVWFTEGFRQREPKKVAWIRQMLAATPATGYAACAGAIRDMDQRWALADIKLPTLIIGGRHDKGTPLSASEFMASRIPGAKLTVLEAAHISNVERSGEFTAALEEFLLQA